MIRVIALAVCLLIVHLSKAQLIVSLQLPPNGVLQKPQLWNMAVTNSSSGPISIHIDLMMSDVRNGVQVMGAATNVITLQPGTTMLSSQVLQPIQYNSLSNSFVIDPGPAGLLPVGDFDVCYSFIRHYSDQLNKIAEECSELIIEPLAPPQLIQPFDGTSIEENSVLFSWLPPMPVSLFTLLRYDFELVQMLPGQSALDAIGQNIPFFRQSGIAVNSLIYPAGAPALERNKSYAWRILVKNNDLMVSQSETWVFKIKDFASASAEHFLFQPYVKPKDTDEGGFAVFTEQLKVDYQNDRMDSLLRWKATDLTKAERPVFDLPTDSIRLKAGQNLIVFDAKEVPFFVNGHFYLLEIFKDNGTRLYIRFEYRKPQ